MTVTIPEIANSNMVAQYWLREILSDAAGDNVGRILPDVDKWRSSFFAQVTDLAGSRNPEVPVRTPIVSIDIWVSGNKGSNKVPMGRLNDVSSFILDKAFKFKGHRLALRTGYPDVFLYSMIASTEPREIPDLQSYGHINFHLEFNWAPVTTP